MTVRDLLIRHEGVRLVPYVDAMGHRTVGCGHNLDAWPLDPSQWESDGTISPTTCDDLLSDDLAAATHPLVVNCSPWFQALDQVRQAVLIDMSFNMGWPVLSEFKTFLGMVSAGNYGAAAADILKTLWAKQVGYRALEDSQMLASGLWFVP